jgi:DNA-binding GntR family transcriptional regulator
MKMEDLVVPAGLTDVKPIREIIYDHLRQSILDGVIKPGERLVERDIAARYAASRTPVREALRKLESEGYLEYIPRKGEVVRGFNVDEIKEIYDIRKALECLAVKNAIRNIGDAEIATLQAIVEQLEREENGRQPQATFKKLHDFDELILNTAKMPLVADFLHRLQESLTRYRKINLSQAPRRLSAIGEHREILQAIIARDVDRAEKAVCRHIDNARSALLKELKREDGKKGK